MPSISVVVPAYNSDRSLIELTERLHAVLPQIADRFEILLVDDGSVAATWSTIAALAQRFENVEGIALSRNYGQHNALLAGIRAASGELIVTMDDDLQHPPEVLPTLLSALDDDIDLVYGYPAEENHEWWRNVSSRLTKSALASSLGSDVAGRASALRVFRAHLASAFDATTDPFVSIDVLLSWATTRVAVIPVALADRPYGESNYSVRKLIRHALNMATGYSTAPLRLVTYLGFGFSFFGMVVLGYVVINYLVRGGAVPGFAFIASAVALFSGVQLFAIGVLGEYLGRMHFRTMQRPPYTIRERTRPRDSLSPRSDRRLEELPPDQVDGL